MSDGFSSERHREVACVQHCANLFNQRTVQAFGNTVLCGSVITGRLKFDALLRAKALGRNRARSLSTRSEVRHLPLSRTISALPLQTRTAHVPCAPARFNPTHHSLAGRKPYDSHPAPALHFLHAAVRDPELPHATHPPVIAHVVPPRSGPALEIGEC